LQCIYFRLLLFCVGCLDKTHKFNRRLTYDRFWPLATYEPLLKMAFLNMVA